MPTTRSIYDSGALLNRIAAERDRRPIMFVLGSPLTSPINAGDAGVPDVNGIINLIRERVRHRCDVDQFLSGPSADRYHQALDVLNANQEHPTQLIRRAVLMARSVEDPEDLIDRLIGGDLACFEKIEKDVGNWHLKPGLASLGKIVAGIPDIFGRVVLTSNFDPLIEISVRCAGGEATSIGIASDASPEIVAQGPACRVLHFHGFWSDFGTLHRPDQLKQARPQLLDAICKYLREYTCVVLAYGAWDDIFMQAVHLVLSGRSGSPAIFWGHFNADPEVVRQQQPPILKELGNLALSRDGFVPYYGIDVNEFLPRLFDLLGRPEPHSTQLSLPAADEKVQPPTRRILAVAAQDGSNSAPQYLDSLWGVDRGRFLGLINMSTEAGAYESLVQTEGRIQSQIQRDPDRTGLPVRWWLRMDATRLAARSSVSKVIEVAIIDSNDPRFRYITSMGIPPGIQLGAFLEMPSYVGVDKSVETLRRCIECFEDTVDGSLFLGIVIRWLHVPIPDFKMVLERSRQFWRGSPLDGLNQVEKYTIEGNGEQDDTGHRQTLTNGQVPSRRSDLLGGDTRIVDMYAQGNLSEEVFLREHGINAFALALRRRLDFPSAVDVASRIDLTCADFWWLVTRLEPTKSRLRQILALTASRRAVWGLCSLEEWRGFGNSTQAEILDMRQGRPLVLK